MQTTEISVHVTSVGRVRYQMIFLVIALEGQLTSADPLSFFCYSLVLQGEELYWPCVWNGIRRPCYLFARKFHPEALDKLLDMFSNYTTI